MEIDNRINWSCFHKNGLTLDESFVFWTLRNYSLKKMIRKFKKLTSVEDAEKIKRTIRMKQSNHLFYTTGLEKGLRSFSEGHHKACLRYGVRIHPVAHQWVLDNRKWAINNTFIPMNDKNNE